VAKKPFVQNMAGYAQRLKFFNTWSQREILPDTPARTVLEVRILSDAGASSHVVSRGLV
jgi:hypothetical protein